MKKYGQSHASDGTVDCLQRAMASYFFQFPLRRGSLYLKLADRIRACEWNGALASINYERLLELSLRNAGLNVVVGGAPEADGGIELCLPHGCCHLFGQVRTTDNIILDSRIRLDSPGIRVIEDPDQHTEELRNSTVPPVMCYFQPDKDTRAGVSFIKAQRQRFKELVAKAEVIGVVGVKVHCRDTHIWDPLRATGARIIYCCKKGTKDDNEFRLWSAEASRKDDEVLPTCWKKDFDALCSAVGIMPIE